MKISLVLLSMIFSLFMPVGGLSQEFSLSGGYGLSRDDIQVFRLGVQTPPARGWISSISPGLELRGEAAYTLLKASGERTQGISLTPVFIYVFKGVHPRLQPYVEAGIGGIWVDDYMINQRNLSSNFLFEDRIGFGIRNGGFDLNFRYMHYSNASLRSPNHRIDIFISTIT